MAISDIFKAGSIKQENEELKQRLADMKKTLKETQDSLNGYLSFFAEHDLTDPLSQVNAFKNEISALLSRKDVVDHDLQQLNEHLRKTKDEVIIFEDTMLFDSFGLYTPRYNLANSEEYKARLVNVRDKQKELIKLDSAVHCTQNWKYNGDAAKGAKLTADMKKLFLRAFNSDCDDVIARVKYNNLEMSEKKIRQSAAAIEKLGKMMDLTISIKYITLKMQELYLVYELQRKLYEEKEESKAARAQMREEAQLRKEMEAKKKVIEKEQFHYLAAYEKAKAQLDKSPDDPELIARVSHLENQLADINASLEDIDYRVANQKAGYVYIISNIGAFGPDVYKIGMTRRLEPQDRVDELGDASVPFKFDVHAMIFADDAPALEAALHRAFEDKKVNMVNPKREFFRVSLDEIKKVVRENYDKTVEFIDYPDAEQYRISEKMRNK